jgi:hypothetical protein
MLDGLNERLEGMVKPLGRRLERSSTGRKVIIAVLLVALALYVKLYLGGSPDRRLMTCHGWAEPRHLPKISRLDLTLEKSTSENVGYRYFS